MRVLVQRVHRAHVTSAPDRDVPGEVAGAIEHGLVALVGVTHDDDVEAADRLGDKLAGLRIFADDAGAMNRSVVDVGGGVLVVSQFTLYGDARKGRRPTFVDAARPEHAEPLVDRLATRVASHGVSVATGVFGTHMEVHLVNDGPVTLLLER